MIGAIWRAVMRFGGTFMVASAVHEPRMWPLVVALGVFVSAELPPPIAETPMAETWVHAVMGGVSADEPRPHFHCERCGAREAQKLPASVTDFVAQSRRFINAHQGCPLPDRGVVLASEELFG